VGGTDRVFQAAWAALTFLRADSRVKGGLMSAIFSEWTWVIYFDTRRGCCVDMILGRGPIYVSSVPNDAANSEEML